MKVAILSSSDIDGGAASVAYNLHKQYQNSGVDSCFIVQKKVSDDYSVIGPENNISKGFALIRPALNQLPVKRYRNRSGQLFSPILIKNNSVLQIIKSLNPDIVHLHWVNGGFITPSIITRINKPIIWTCHDSWPFTGGCHILNDCKKYMDKCGNCPVLGSRRHLDLSHRIWRAKKCIFNNNISALTTPSTWMSGCAEKSSLAAKLPVYTIHNGLNLEKHKGIQKDTAREILNIRIDKKVILFGAITATKDKNKGWDLLQEALVYVDQNVHILVIGASEPEEDISINQSIQFLGRLNDDISLNLVYSAADLLVVPSRQESFGLMAIEAMACNTPVVSFNTSGLKDIIKHKENGFLADKFNTQELAEGINWVLQEVKSDNRLGTTARNHVEEKFNIKMIAKQYLDLYEKIFNNYNII